jgi:hypothetical protein
MELIREFETQLKFALSTAHTGTMAPENAVIMLAHAEGAGFGTVKFVSMRMVNGDILELLYSYDTGAYTVGTMIPINGSIMVVTNDRRYLVTKQHTPGDSLSIEDTRLTSMTQSPGCGIMVHIGSNTYKVLTQGTFQCTVGTGNKHKIATWGTEQFITLGHMDSCHTECMSIGPALYRTEYRDLGTYPSVHSVMLRNYAPTSALVMKDMANKPTEHDKLQRELHALITDTRTQLDIMNIEQAADNAQLDVSSKFLSWAAYIGIGILVIVVTVLGCMLYWHRKKNKPETQSDRAAGWGTARRDQGQIMEMRIIPRDPEYGQYGQNRGKILKGGRGEGGDGNRRPVSRRIILTDMFGY